MSESHSSKMKQNMAHTKLANGMNILACRHGSSPKVLVQIAYHVGSAHETDGERGLAHLLEHMVFKGTHTNLKEGDIDAIARKYGADYNAFTSNDMTSYYFEVNKENWEPFVAILAECMTDARFEKEHLASEVKAVIQELRMYNDSYWHAMIEGAFQKLYPSNHPYHAPVIGYKEDLADITPDDLYRFYKKHYQPNKAVLCIVGDVDPEQALSVAKPLFESIPASDHDPVQPNFPVLKNNFTADKTVIYRDVSAEQLGLYWRIPGLDGRCEQVMAGLEYVLGGSVASRLYKQLVDIKKVASSVRVDAEQMFSSGFFFITVQNKPGKRDECIALIEQEIEAIVRDGVNEQVITALKASKQRQFWQYLQSIQSFTVAWIESFFVTGKPYAICDVMEKLNEVTSEQIKNAAAQYLGKLSMNQVVVKALPKEHQPAWHESQQIEENYFKKLLTIHDRTEPLETPEHVHRLEKPRDLDFEFPVPTLRTVLDNKLIVVTKEQGSLPLVTTSLMFKKAGYFARSLDGLGIEVMMGLLLEGTSELSREEILALFDQHGAQYAYHERGGSCAVVSEHMERVLRHFFTVLRNPVFPDAALEKVKGMYRDMFARKKDSPRSIGMRVLRSQIYGSEHPYCWSFDEAESYVESLTSDELRQLHAQYVKPNEMVFGVVGAINAAEVTDFIRSLTADWEAGPEQEVCYPPFYNAPANTIDVPLLRDQAVLLYGRPSDMTIDHPDHISLDLLSSICFHSLGSRLYMIREKTGLFYAASGGWAIDIHQEHGFDYIMTILNKDNVDGADHAVRELLARVASDGITEQELAAAKQLYIKDLVDMTSHSGTLCGMFVNVETIGISSDYYNQALKRVQAATVDDLNRVARQYIKPDQFTRVMVGRTE